MNALVSVRNNTTGMLSPTPKIRTEVSETLATTAAAREGQSTVKAASSSAKSTSSDAAAATTSSSATPSVINSDSLDKESFLKLLVLQMQNQDPLEPTDNSQMLAQLAQFSALEAQTNLNESFVQMTSNIDQLNFMSASQMLGRYVEGVDNDGNLHAGTVQSVHLDGSLVVLNVDGKPMSMAGILRIEDRVLDAASSTGS